MTTATAKSNYSSPFLGSKAAKARHRAGIVFLYSRGVSACLLAPFFQPRVIEMATATTKVNYSGRSDWRRSNVLRKVRNPEINPSHCRPSGFSSERHPRCVGAGGRQDGFSVKDDRNTASWKNSFPVQQGSVGTFSPPFLMGVIEMATATVRKSVRATKATPKVNLYQRLWLACRLMNLSPEEYTCFHKDVYGDPPPAFRGEKLGGKFCRQTTVPSLALGLDNRQAIALLQKVDQIDRERKERHSGSSQCQGR